MLSLSVIFFVGGLITLGVAGVFFASGLKRYRRKKKFEKNGEEVHGVLIRYDEETKTPPGTSKPETLYDAVFKLSPENKEPFEFTSRIPMSEKPFEIGHKLDFVMIESEFGKRDIIPRVALGTIKSTGDFLIGIGVTALSVFMIIVAAEYS